VHFNAILEKRQSTDPHKPGMPGIGQGPKTLGGTISNPVTNLSDCDKQITPDCLRALYGILYSPLSPSKNSFGIGELIFCDTFWDVETLTAAVLLG
jgi:tripeptidyl-peptidase-1